MPARVARTATEGVAADGAGLDRDPAATAAKAARPGVGARPARAGKSHLMGAACAPRDLGSQFGVIREAAARIRSEDRAYVSWDLESGAPGRFDLGARMGSCRGG